MASSNSPCAACKFLRRKCTTECVFAPYFPPDNPQKFANVHKVFGASNVAKLLNDLNSNQREDAVNSLAYEADARLRDPVYGCVGLISILQHRLKQVQHDLLSAKKELASYIGPSAMLPILQHPGFIQQNLNVHPMVLPYNMQPGMPAGQANGATQMMIRDQQHHQQMLEAQQLAREQQEMIRTYEQRQNPEQPELVRYNNGFDTVGQVTASGFNHMNGGSAMSLALGSYDNNPYQIQQQAHDHSHPLELLPQLLLEEPHQNEPLDAQVAPQELHQHRAGSEEVRSIGLSGQN